MKGIKALIICSSLAINPALSKEKVPKCMIPVNERPFLDYLIEYLQRFNLEVVLSIGHMAEKIVTRYPKLKYVLDNPPSGTGGSLRRAMETIDLGEDFFVVDGGLYIELNYDEMYSIHKRTGAFVTCSLSKVRKPLRDILVKGGVYLFNRKIEPFIRLFRNQKEFDLDDIVNSARYKAFEYIISEEVIDIGTQEGYSRFSGYVKHNPLCPFNLNRK